MPKKTHILMIDDDAVIRRLFGGKLASAGFHMSYAADGNEGREMARRFQPDLILLDIRMPDTDGYQVASRLHDEPKTKNIPIVFLTNEDITPEAEKALRETWRAGYLHKSMDLNDFVKEIKQILQGKRPKSQSKKGD